MERVITTPESNLACLVIDTDVFVVELPSLAVVAELGIESGSELAIVRERIVVLAPSGRMCVVDPTGPSLVDERALEPGTRLLAASSTHVVLSGPLVVELDDDGALVTCALPARWGIVAAGATPDPARFLAARHGCIDELDAVTRAPRRRFHLARSITPALVGATSRSVWYVAGPVRDELVVLPRAPGGAMFASMFDEPIGRVVAVTAGSLLVCSSTSRRAWWLKLGERRAVSLELELDDVAPWRPGVCLATRAGALELLALRADHATSHAMMATTSAATIASHGRDLRASA